MQLYYTLRDGAMNVVPSRAHAPLCVRPPRWTRESLPRAGDVEDAGAGVPQAGALHGADHRLPERPELERRLVLVVHEGADVAQIDEEPLGPGEEEVVRLDPDDVEIGGGEEAVHLGLRVAELGEPETLSARLPEPVEGPQRRVHDEAAKRVVERHDNEEEPAGLEHAVDLPEEHLGAVLEVLGHVRRERGVERVVTVWRVQCVGLDQTHVGIVPSREAQRTPAVVDSEGQVAERLEERHPPAAPASRLEDAQSLLAAEVLAEDRRRPLVVVDGREVDVEVAAAGVVFRPGLVLGVGLVQPRGDLAAEILLEAHPARSFAIARRGSSRSPSNAAVAAAT